MVDSEPAWSMSGITSDRYIPGSASLVGRFQIRINSS
jgi:hypothetical protein